MSATIQITKTPQLEDTLSFIRSKYVLLSDEDIIKMSISSQYRILQEEDETTRRNSHKSFELLKNRLQDSEID